MKSKIFFVFSLSSGNTSKCFGEPEQAVKTRSAGVKCDGFGFVFFFYQRFTYVMARTKDSCLVLLYSIEK